MSTCTSLLHKLSSSEFWLLCADSISRVKTRYYFKDKPVINDQYSRRECVEIVGIPSSVHQNQLEDSVCKIFEKLNCNLVKGNLEDCHRLKGDRVIVKFSKRKDCKQVLSVKNDLKNINMADLGFEGNGSIYTSQSLRSYYKCCGHGAESYTIWEEFTAGLCLLLSQMTSLSIFLTSILQHFIIVNKFIISFLFAKLSFCWFYLFLASQFMFGSVFIYDLTQIN